MSNRDSIICIARDIRIDKDYRNTLALSQTELMSLCQANSVYAGSDYSFLRTEKRIKVQASFSQVFNGNYCYIINQGIRQFFFIDKINYISDTTTELFVIEDVISTYKHKGFNAAYVERQHTQDDSVLNLAQERINFERYVRNRVDHVDVTPIKIMAEYSECITGDVGGNWWENPANFKPTNWIGAGSNCQAGMVATGLEKGIPSMMYRDKMNNDSDLSPNETLNTSGLTVLVENYHAYNTAGHGSSLLGVKTYPQCGKDITTSPKVTSLDGYTPKNKKCLQYPYYYINLANNKGQSNLLKPEMFPGNPVFETDKCCHGIVQSFIYPKNYNNIEFAYDFGLSIDNYPQLPMSIDSYSQYMGQRGAEVMNGVVGSAITGGIGLLTGNPAVAGMGFASSAASAISSLAFHPDNKGDGVVGSATGDFLNYAIDNFKFRIEHMTLTYQDAKRLDDYFTAFGYAQNEIQQIRTTNPRFHCHFIKTISGEGVIEGIPHEKADIINRAFANGITFWDSNDNVGNYNLK